MHEPRNPHSARGLRRAPVVLGALAWILALQFFPSQALTAAAWPRPYSLSRNTISDLANTRCRLPLPGMHHALCSPMHDVMAGSFLLLGAGLVFGALSTWQGWPHNRTTAVGLGLVVVAGFGVLLVGWQPENLNIGLHMLGAKVQFYAGSAAMFVLGTAARPRSSYYTWLSWILGAVGLAGTVLWFHRHFLGIGTGGMERVAAYPFVVWIVVSGAFLLFATRRRSRCSFQRVRAAQYG